MKKILPIFPLLLILFSATLSADELPEKKWALGVGIGSVYGPDYRGADEYRSFTSVIPYLVYHGKFIRSDLEGLKSTIFCVG
jgi:outer membrane protein